MIRLFTYFFAAIALCAGFSAGAAAGGVSFPNAPLGPADDTAPETIDGLLALPDGDGPFPAVVLLHTCGGVSPHVSKDWPDFLTANGYAALTVDTFGSRNAGRCPEALHLRGQPMARDAYGALAYLAGRSDIDGERIGVMGFSLGAFAIEGFAASYGNDAPITAPGGWTFKAGISAYGGCTLVRPPFFPVLAIIGDQDRNSGACPGTTHKATGLTNPAITGVTVEKLRATFHAFDVRAFETMRIVSGNHQALYDEESTQKARALTLEFLAAHLGK